MLPKLAVRVRFPSPAPPPCRSRPCRPCHSPARSSRSRPTNSGQAFGGRPPRQFGQPGTPASRGAWRVGVGTRCGRQHSAGPSLTRQQEALRRPANLQPLAALMSPPGQSSAADQLAGPTVIGDPLVDANRPPRLTEAGGVAMRCVQVPAATMPFRHRLVLMQPPEILGVAWANRLQPESLRESDPIGQLRHGAHGSSPHRPLRRSVPEVRIT
jgi:hypothetical protein